MSTYTDQQKQHFLQKALVAFEDGLIKKGPSREELFDSLKYFMMPEHQVTMTLGTSLGASSEVDFKARVVKIEVEDGSMQKWMVSLEIMAIQQGRKFQSVREFNLPQFRAYYDSQLREGSIVPQELSVRNGAIYRGSRKIADLPTRVI